MIESQTRAPHLVLRVSVEKVCVALLPIAATATYFQSVSAQALGLVVVGILVTLAITNNVGHPARVVNHGGAPPGSLHLAVCLAYLAVGTLPALHLTKPVVDVSGLVMDVGRYGIVLLALAFGALNSIRRHFQTFVNSFLLMAVALSILGLCSLLIGDFEVIGFTVNRYFDMQILGYSLPTTSSLFSQPNYYGMFLLSSLVLLLAYGTDVKLPWWGLRVLSILLLGSIFVTRSRSALGLALFFLLLVYIRWARKKVGLGRIFVTFTIGTLIVTLGAYTALNIVRDGSTLTEYYAELSDQITGAVPKLARGLNDRDALTYFALQLFGEQPGGYGFGNVDDAMATTDASNLTPQSTLLTTLLSGGIPAVTIYYSAVLLSLIILGKRGAIFGRRTCSGEADRKFSTALWYLLLMITLDGFVRTYMFGGIGAMPFLATIAILFALSRVR